MAEPPSEEQKTSAVEPIVFTIGKHKPDIRMFVFSKEFHVYSAVLKIHSSYFGAFLEPAAGMQPHSTSVAFKSDWFTNAEVDGSWYLSADHKHANMKIDNDLFDAQTIFQQEEAFHNTL